MERQQDLFNESKPTVAGLLKKRENQWFDRKSFRIEARGLADAMIGFANADGGRIAVGIWQGDIEGVASSLDHLNELLQAALDFSVPPVRHEVLFLDCIDRDDHPKRLLVIDVEASEGIHRNKKYECFLRVGDENRKLGPAEERELAFDKGESVYDKTVVNDLDYDDLDFDAIQSYAQKIGASDIPGLLRSRSLYCEHPRRRGVTQAGWLLFGNVPPIWSYIRYLRYAGTTVETGVRSNLAEDIILEGTIPSLIAQARSLLKEKTETVIRQTASGRFERVPTLPEFAWLEAVVNAVTHRAYSLQGDGIRVTQFDDRLEVESPGRLPGLVRVENIRNSRFSRNPHIARVLSESTGYVRELNEGVKRMFEEMERYGLPAPTYSVTDSSVRVTLYKQPVSAPPEGNANIRQMALLEKRLGKERLEVFLTMIKRQGQVSTNDVVQALRVTAPTARGYLKLLEEAGVITRQAKSPNDPKSLWTATDRLIVPEAGAH